MSETLKPCPFCGGPAAGLEISIAAQAHDLVLAQIGCDTCGFALSKSGPEIDASHAVITAWNRRSPQDVGSREAPRAFEAVFPAGDGMAGETYKIVRADEWGSVKALRAAGWDVRPLYTAPQPAPVGETEEYRDQPVVVAADGMVRFRGNPIVRYLLDGGPFDMNDLAVIPFPAWAREQFAQLIGYSVGGYGELSYVTDEAYERAKQAAARLTTQEGHEP